MVSHSIKKERGITERKRTCTQTRYPSSFPKSQTKPNQEPAFYSPLLSKMKQGRATLVPCELSATQKKKRKKKASSPPFNLQTVSQINTLKHISLLSLLLRNLPTFLVFFSFLSIVQRTNPIPFKLVGSYRQKKNPCGCQHGSLKGLAGVKVRLT